MTSPQKPFYMVIAGNIGVGKTTMTKVICDHFEWYEFYENFGDNPYLEDFYANMSKWAFQSQIFFLKERIKEHNSITKIKRPCVQDRSIYEDAEIFARNLYERGIMAERDFDVYSDLYAGVSNFLRKPDLFVYLRASAWTLLSRIRKRGREFEQSIDKEYLMQLNTLYEAWIDRMAQAHNVLMVDTDNFNIDTDDEYLGSILQEIERVARDR